MTFGCPLFKKLHRAWSPIDEARVSAAMSTGLRDGWSLMKRLRSADLAVAGGWWEVAKLATLSRVRKMAGFGSAVPTDDATDVCVEPTSANNEYR